MKNKKSDPPVTRSEFLKETGSIRELVSEETGSIRREMATKQDFNKLANEIVKIQTDMKTMATKEDIRQEIGKVLNAIDTFAQKSENYDRKAVFHDSRINDHEERITHLEKTVIK